jgi:hypothetical protein
MAQNHLFDQLWETKSNAVLESQKDRLTMIGDLQKNKQLNQLANETSSRLNYQSKRQDKTERENR